MKKTLMDDHELLEVLDETTSLDSELYKKYSVKQGLRNEDGTGVLVGITRISGVFGYEYIDGKKIPSPGRLLYRGIPIEDLVQGIYDEGRLGYEEIAFLLLFGKLPTRTQLGEAMNTLTQLCALPEHFKEDVFFKIPCRTLMNKLQRVVLTLYSYDPNPDDTSIENSLLQAYSLIAKMPLLVAYSYRAKLHYFDDKSLIIHQPVPGAHVAENLLHMIRDDSRFEPWEAKLLDLCLIVQADHGGGNNSTFTTHVISSTGTDTYSAIAAAIGSLKGPKHGGANAKVLAMIDDIKKGCNWKNPESLRSYLKRILEGEAFDHSGLIYGMGHAVYTLSDPRTELLKEATRSVVAYVNMESELELRENIEKISQELMIEMFGPDKKVCANVDMYTGLVYHILRIPDDLDTPIFALARLAGWCAHRLEQLQDKKIMRPAYVSLGENHAYVPLSKR